MNEFMNRIFWDNPVKNYFIVSGIILFIILVKRYLSHYIAGLFFRSVTRVWKNLDSKMFKDLLVQPLSLFLVILTALITLYRLNFPSVLNEEIYRYTVKEIVQAIGTSILIFSFIWLLLRIIDFLAVLLEKRANLTADQTDNQLIVFFKDFFKVLIAVIGILMVLKFAFNLNIGTLLTGLSIVGAAIALALRESLENLIASFIIFFDKPFTTGDLVKVHNITGSVEKIGLRSTRIRTDQKTFVTVPNKQMVDSILDNLSLRTQRKGEVKLGIDQTATAQQMEQLLAAVKKLLQHPLIENHAVFLTDITANSFDINAEYFTAPIAMEEFNTLRQHVNISIIQLLQEHKLELAGAATDIKVSGKLD